MTNEQKLYGEQDWDQIELPNQNKFTNLKDLFLKFKPGKNQVRIVTNPFHYAQHEWSPPESKQKYPYRVNCAATSYKEKDKCPLCAQLGAAQEALLAKLGGDPKSHSKNEQLMALRKQMRKDRWLVGVIDRETNSYKILDFKNMINQRLLSLKEEYGSPKNYDLLIKVNPGNPANYYEVFNKPATPLSASDLELAAKADLKLLSERVTPPTADQVRERMTKIMSEIGVVSQPVVADDSEDDFQDADKMPF